MALRKEVREVTIGKQRGEGEEKERKCAPKEGCGERNQMQKQRASREGQMSPWAGKFRVQGRVCHLGTEGCWKNLEAKSTLVYKNMPLKPVLGREILANTRLVSKEDPHSKSQ